MNVIKELWHGNIIPQEDSKISAKQIYRRIISYLAEVDLHKLDNNSLSNEQKETVERAEEYLKTLNIVIDDEPMLTVDQVEERLEKENNLGLVIIDYLELLTANGKFKNRVHEISEISRKLHILTKRKYSGYIYQAAIAQSRIQRR